MRDWLEQTLVRARAARRLHARVPVVCVGGTLLGGTGKTPVAIAAALSLARQGVKVALVGHAYRARPARARVVRPDDPIDEVGDEALLGARALEGRARVVVAPRRQAAIDLAHQIADVLVIDGVLQLAPRRAALSILTTHGRAHPALVALADVVTEPELELEAPWERLRAARVGLITCLARPHRVRAALEAHGVIPRVHREHRNHGPARFADDPKIDVWVATEKCALHVPSPVITLVARARLALDPPLSSTYASQGKSAVIPRV